MNKYSTFLIIGLVLMAAVFLAACTPRTNNDRNQTSSNNPKTTSESQTTANQPIEEQNSPAPLSTSTELNDLEKEINGTTIGNEDFSDF